MASRRHAAAYAHGWLARAAGTLGSLVLDPTIVLSFDRSGYRRHALQFRSDDLAVDLRGKTCLVTGANSGIGKETAALLAARGADVWLLCRSRERGAPVVEELRAATGNAAIYLAELDVSRLGALRAFADRFPPPRVDVLIHNAGVLPAERRETEDGIELTLATNVVGPFLLTHLLLPRLLAAPQGRIVTVSSGGMYPTKLTLDDPQARTGAFDGVQAYSWTKRAQVVLTELWAERLAATTVTVNAMHPGWADTPSVRSSIPRFWELMRHRLRSPAEGADTVAWLAACPRLADRSGCFWFDRAERATHYLPWTRERAADRAGLWRLCCELAGVSVDDVDAVVRRHRSAPPEAAAPPLAKEQP